MTGRFAAATAVTRLDRAEPADRSVRSDQADRSDGIVRYGGEVHDGWDIGGNANGGYLLAIAGRAMADAVGRPPLTITAHYLRPAPPGPCSVDVDVIRSGRRLATVSATLSMAGSATLQLVGTFGDQQPGGPTVQQVGPVELPPFDECPVRPQTAELPALMANLDSRIHPDDGTYALGRPSGTPLIRGWFAHADGEPIDAYSLLLAADAFPPPVFNTDVPVAWVPTIELTVHIRGVPAPGPLRCSFRSRFIHDGLLDEDGEIWDSSGALVCQSRQLSLMPRPPE